MYGGVLPSRAAGPAAVAVVVVSVVDALVGALVVALVDAIVGALVVAAGGVLVSN